MKHEMTFRLCFSFRETCTDKNFKLNVMLCLHALSSSAGYVLLTTCFPTQNVYTLTFMTGVTSLNFIIVDFSRILVKKNRTWNIAEHSTLLIRQE